MKKLLLIAISFLLSACDKDERIISPPETKKIAFHEYGSLIDSAFFKLWSDGSWEKFYRIVKVNNNNYVTIVNSDSTEYLYNDIGYAGFKPRGEDFIMFSSPLLPLPDTLEFDRSITRRTTFKYAGYTWEIDYTHTLKDTSTISIPMGNFSECAHLHSTVKLKTGDYSEQSNGDTWFAKGPSDIKSTLTL